MTHGGNSRRSAQKSPGQSPNPTVGRQPPNLYMGRLSDISLILASKTFCVDLRMIRINTTTAYKQKFLITYN